jgi:hypothetical protein
MDTAILVFLVLLVVMVAGTWYTLFQLVRQQGRILLRLDEIDARVASAPMLVEPAPAREAQPVAADAVAYEPPRGIAVGESVPSSACATSTAATSRSSHIADGASCSCTGARSAASAT